MADEYEYFANKRPDRVYLSRSLEAKSFEKGRNGEVKEIARPFRIVSKIVECAENHQFIRDGKEVSLRITQGERQEITAKFYEDTRGIFTLQIQKYTRKTGMPHSTYFTFTGNEISILYNFLRNIELLPLDSSAGTRLDDRFVEELVLSKEQALRLLHEQPELLNELINREVTTEDVVNLGYRRDQLAIFRRLIEEFDYFDNHRISLGQNKRPEDVWQDFFERNNWIFGYGLNYFFNTPLDGQKLEQVVSGYDFSKSGKRVDALLKTQGMVSALAFGEIKTHETKLLDATAKPYRGESWAISRDLAGGVAQIQRTVQRSVQNLLSKTEIRDSQGKLTGEQLFLYQPRAFLVIGSLSEFEGEYGVNEEQYSSFELFRRSLHNFEVITFDELYERARYIVESHSEADDAA